MKNLRVSVVLFLFINGCILLISCQKKCYNKHYQLSERQLSFVDAEKGSYWIMKDSITGIQDSIVLEDILYETWSNGSGECFAAEDKYQQKKLVFKSKEGSNFYTRIRANENTLFLKVNGVKSEAHITFGQFPKTYVLNNITYNEVFFAHFHYDPFQGNEESMTIYFNLDSYFIKLRYMTPYKSRVLELQKAHIIK